MYNNIITAICAINEKNAVWQERRVGEIQRKKFLYLLQAICQVARKHQTERERNLREPMLNVECFYIVQC